MSRALLRRIAVACLSLSLLAAAAPGESTAGQAPAASQAVAADHRTPSAPPPPVTARGWRGLGPGHLVETHPAGATSRVAPARRSVFVRYTTTDRRGRPALASGLVLLPPERGPRGGAPLVVYGHMTTGAADACAPTHGVAGSSELRRMQQGDTLAAALLEGGAVVARPDYEGLGEKGPHPYLRGRSLARSMRDLASAVSRHYREVGPEWVAAGHSEGGVAALHTGARRTTPAAGLDLVGVSAITPVTQVEVLATLFGDAPVTTVGIDVVVALAALILKGLTAEDPALRRLLLRQGGLSEEARALWPHLERRCLEDLGAEDSWGGLAPAEVQGPRGGEALAEMKAALRADDVRHLRMRRAVPIRIDAGALDLVAPLPLTQQLADDYRARGYDTTLRTWPADHSPTADVAATDLATWILGRFHA